MAWRESFRQSRKLCRWERSPGGAVAQRLRGFESAEPEKTVKRSSRRTGVNLQFFPVEPSSLGLKGASSPFFVAPARRNRWWFSGSLLPPKENIPRLPPPTPQRCNCRFFSTLSVKINREAPQNFPVDRYKSILYYSERSSSWQYSTIWWNICSTAGAIEAGRCTARPTTR